MPLVYKNEKVVPHSEESVTDDGVRLTIKSNVFGHLSIRGCRSSMIFRSSDQSSPSEPRVRTDAKPVKSTARRTH